MKDEKEIERIAKQIAYLEKQCQNDIANKDKYMQDMAKIISRLSLEEIFMIDEYILENHLLNK